jgi:hypothetical protein
MKTETQQKKNLPVTRKLVLDGSFSEDDAEANRTNVNPDFYDWLFDHDVFVCHPKDRSKLFDSKIITRNPKFGGGKNIAWAGDSNPKFKEIRDNMIENQFILNYLPWILLEKPNGEIILMDRRTTDAIVVGEFNFTNIIGCLFKVRTVDKNDPKKKVSFTDDEIADAVSKLGTMANVRSDVPKGKITTEDLFKELGYAHKKGWIETNPPLNGGDPLPDIDAILERINEICGPAFLGKKKRWELAARVRNNFDTSNTTRGWESTALGKKWLTEGTRNFKDTMPVFDFDEKGRKCTKKGIKYVIVQTNVNNKLGTVGRLYEEEPDYEYRVILFTGVLIGYDTRETFWIRLNRFVSEWERDLTNISDAFFRGAAKIRDNIKIYGAFPMLQVDSDPDLDDMPQDLEKMIYRKGSSWVQK